MGKFRFIAFYLPQYHPTPNNDRWYGAGFTEWTNLGKARKCYPGHDFPHVPGELGYYDLRLPETREAQANLAREYGIEGFCYYHYWFGNGVRELERPFHEVLHSGKPDFPFCLCWANQTWKMKMWNKDAVIDAKILQEQRYPGPEDERAHFEACLPAFRDPRYIRVDGKPLFMIYRPLELPDPAAFMEHWRRLARENGLEGIFFIGQTPNADRELAPILETGVDGVNTLRMHDYRRRWNPVKYALKRLWWNLSPYPKIVNYKDVSRFFIAGEDRRENVFPSVLPNWDHSPRSGRGGSIIHGSSPQLFERNVRDALNAVEAKQPDHRLIFIKSWNEWGEGNYMEPDLRFGRGYLEALKHAVESEATGSPRSLPGPGR